MRWFWQKRWIPPVREIIIIDTNSRRRIVQQQAGSVVRLDAGEYIASIETISEGRWAR